MNIKIFFLFKFLFIFGVIIMGCADPLDPQPFLTNGRSDSGMVMSDIIATDSISSDSPRVSEIDSNSNAYICACKALIPLNCADGCGTIFSGTGVVTLDGDNYCDTGLRNLRVCYPEPRNLNLSFQDLDRDCRTRVQDNIREALRWGFRNRCNNNPPGFGPCEIRYGCAAMRLDHTVTLIREDRCMQPCDLVPLMEINMSPWANYREATYVPASIQYRCGQEHMDTSRACGNLAF
jgi:hypothetical protein